MQTASQKPPIAPGRNGKVCVRWSHSFSLSIRLFHLVIRSSRNPTRQFQKHSRSIFRLQQPV